MDIDRVLERLERVKRSRSGWTARCPAHDDRTPSLRVWESDDGWVRFKCYAGCTREAILAAIGLEVHDLGPERGGDYYPSQSTSTRQHAPGCTLEQYSEAKRLPLDFLMELGLSDMTLLGRPAVRIPYLDAAGGEISIRYRVALTGDLRVKAKAGSKLHLYGLNRLERARELGYVVVVEGESCTQTLWLHDFPALGLPGANTWNEERDAGHLEGVSAIYVLIEPDRGGRAVLDWLSRSVIRDRVRLVRLEDAKDVSELYLHDPERLRERFEAALQTATPWAEHERIASELRRREAWAACDELARAPRILDRLVEATRRIGVVGEERLVKLCYLATVSRLLDRIVSLALKGPSAAGKSYIVAITLRFFREGSDYYAYTGMSERALVFGEEDLRQRMIVIYEATGLEEGFHAYIVRSLLSEGRISYPITEKGADGKHRTRTVVREGPTGLIVTTTAVHLHDENETRLVSLLADDSPAQTKRILLSLAGEAERESTAAVDFRPWHALQAWLSEEPAPVLIPFATTLAERVPPAAVRLRRDFGAVLALTSAHALLHRATRDMDRGAVVATLEDYEIVRDLIADLIADGLEATVPPTIRETVAAVEALQGSEADPKGVSLTALAHRLSIDKAAVSRRWRVARDRGYLENLETQRGRAARIVLADPLPEEVEILPTLDTLKNGCTVDRDFEERPAPPPEGDSDPIQEELDHYRGVLAGDRRPLLGNEGYLDWLYGKLSAGVITASEFNRAEKAHRLVRDGPSRSNLDDSHLPF